MTRRRTTYAHPTFETSDPTRSFVLSSVLEPPDALDALRGHRAYALELRAASAPADEAPRWRSGALERSPWRAWVREDGASAVLFAHDQLVHYDPAGEPRGRADVARTLWRFAEQAKRSDLAFFVRNTAGLWYTRSPLGFFAPSPRAAKAPAGVFCLRLPLGLRVCFALDAPTLEPFVAAGALDEPFLAAEREAVARALDASSDEALRAYAAQAAGQLGLVALAPALRALDADPSLATRLGYDHHAPYYRSPVRLAAQLALVRLGAYVELHAGCTRAPGLAARPAGWLAALLSLAPGVTRDEVYERVGGPNDISWHGGAPCWRYDLPDEARAGWSLTLRLRWRDERLEALVPEPLPRVGDPTREER